MKRAALAILAAFLGCRASPAPAPRPAAPHAAPAADPSPGAPRWVLGARLGITWDEAGTPAPAPRPEPAIIDGVRVIVDHGVVLGSARHTERLTGFRTLPERLGGGVLVWSEDRIYRAPSLLGELTPLADVGAAGGARPWLRSVLLRTSAGLLDLDLTAPSLRRADMPGITDAMALDARRAARLDALGRASYTLDGGATWTDLLAARGILVHAIELRESEAPEIWFSSHQTSLVLGAEGDVHPLALDPIAAHRFSPVLQRSTVATLGDARPPSSRALPYDIVSYAVAYGALAAGGRVVVTREGGVRTLAVSTLLPVADASLEIDDRFKICQAFSDAPGVLLACAGDAGAEVLDLDAGLARPALEATFPRGGGGFLSGPHGRLAYDGRCGPDAPGSTDLGPAAKPTAEVPDENAQPTPAPEPAAPVDPPSADDARACVRARASRWIERRLRGADARNLYRWIPGDDGTAVALVLAGPDEGGEDGGAPERFPAPEGVRVIRVDPADASLGGAAFPALPPSQREMPYRTIDPDFWIDDDGTVRGWIRLPREGEDKIEITQEPQGASSRKLHVSPGRGGRLAGVRIDASGHVSVLPLPKGVSEVVTGGRFAMATGPGDHGEAWFESTDGGASWTPIEAPPVGHLQSPADEHAPFACSALGCTWGTGLMRVGWGGPKPEPVADLPVLPAKATRPRPPSKLALSCKLDAAEPLWRAAPKKNAVVPIALRMQANVIGVAHDHTWTGDVLPPFQPGAGPRHLSAGDPAVSAARGGVAPVLTARGPVELLLTLDRRRLRVGSGPAAFTPFEVTGKPSIAAELAGDALLIFDAERGSMWIAQKDATAAALRLTRTADVTQTRITLGRRIEGGLAVVAYSASSGEIAAGDLDLGRAEVGPFAPLGGPGSLGEPGSCAKATHRLLLELPATVKLTGRSGASWLDRDLTLAVLASASREALCVEAVEAVIPEGHASVLRATLGQGASASVWSASGSVRGVCSLRR